MCGVVGYSSNNPIEEHYEILQGLLRESKIRGLHSFGYTYYDKELVTRKYHNLEELTIPRSNKIIFHNRYSTSGDYIEHKNNQPITKQYAALVFNGVLDMRTKVEMEEHYNIQMETDNDGEIVLLKCGKDIKALRKFVTSTKGSFAGLMLTEDNKMYAIRNTNRPLWKLEYKEAHFYASTEDIFKRTNKDFKPKQLFSNVVYES